MDDGYDGFIKSIILLANRITGTIKEFFQWLAGQDGQDGQKGSDHLDFVSFMVLNGVKCWLA